MGSKMDSYAGNKGTMKEEDFWNDPDLLNNPEKLMKMKFTSDDMKLATSTDFVENTAFVTELVLQDAKIKEILKKHQSITVIDQNAGVKHMQNVTQSITNEQAKCLQIISDVKNKPFWNKKGRAKLLDESQQSNVQRWIDTVDQFSSTFERAQLLRVSRRSILPTDQPDPIALKIVFDLKDIYNELSAISKVFDAL